MVLSVVLSLAGLIPVLVDKKLLPIADKKYHPLVGLATLVVAFVQPFIGYFRPSKDHQFRPLFKLFHTFFGYSAILMGIASIFLTNDLEVDISLQPQRQPQPQSQPQPQPQPKPQLNLSFAQLQPPLV